MTEPLCASNEFFVGLSGSHGIGGYTSELRMVDANKLFMPDGVGDQKVDIYFGLRDATQTGSPLFADPNDYIRGGHIAGPQGLTYRDNLAPPVGVNNEPALASFTDEFSWIHYETDAADDTIIFTVDMKDTGASLTEWVAYFVLPDAMPCIEDDPYLPGEVPADNDGLVFSWTVHATDGVGEQNWPDPDEPPSIFTVPEPSSVFLLFSGAGMMLLRRNRKAA